MPEPPDLERRVAALEAQISGNRPKKDLWDILGVVGGLATPLVVAALGIYLPYQLAKSQRARDESARERELIAAEAAARVGKASIIPPLMDALLGPDPARRRLAVSTLLIALPTEGPEIARLVATSDPDPNVQSYARTSLGERKEGLIADLFASDSATRGEAAQRLVAGWRDDPALPAELIQYASERRDNANGVYNTVVVLGSLSKGALVKNREAILEFLTSAQGQGPKTRQAADNVRSRIR